MQPGTKNDDTKVGKDVDTKTLKWKFDAEAEPKAAEAKAQYQVSSKSGKEQLRYLHAATLLLASVLERINSLKILQRKNYLKIIMLLSNYILSIFFLDTGCVS